MTQTARLTASDGAANAYFGYSVATSGNTVVVGAPQAAVSGNSAEGATYVFTQPAAGWTSMIQTATLTASDGAADDEFGCSVAIDGDAVVVGSPDATVDGNFAAGAAYVFVEPAAGWASMTQTAELTASDGAAMANFGQAVSISGNTIVVGGAGRHGQRQHRGGGGLRLYGARRRLGQHDPNRQAHLVR